MIRRYSYKYVTIAEMVLENHFQYLMNIATLGSVRSLKTRTLATLSFCSLKYSPILKRFNLTAQ